MSDYGGNRFKQPPQKSEKYTIPGGDLCLIAGDTFYRVHRYFFERESSKFKEILNKPSPPGAPKIASSASTAIELDATSDEMDKLLWIFYNPKFAVFKAPVEDWATILKLASRWRFPEVKELALRELENADLDTIDRIVLYQECHVEEDIMVPYYAQMCVREEPLSIKESEKLGIVTTTIIFQIREICRSQAAERGKSPLPDNVDDEEIEDTIRDILNGVPPSNRKSISFSGLAATYEEALAQINPTRTRKLRRVTREERIPAEAVAMDTITEGDTEASSPVATERSQRTDDASDLSEDIPADTHSNEWSGDTGQETITAEEFDQESSMDEEVESFESFSDAQGETARRSRDLGRLKADWRLSICSTGPPVPGAWD